MPTKTPGTLYFDIETGPRPEVLANPERWCKADARLKDPEKIKADLQEKAEAGGLSPITGEILAIGYSQDGEEWCDVVGKTMNETDMIQFFLDHCERAITKGYRIAGFNCLDFDLPFLMFRANVLGLWARSAIGSMWHSKFSPHEFIIDLQRRVLWGKRDATGYSLDRVAKAFGFEGKAGNGADFAKLLETDREAAIAYLRNDIKQTALIGERILSFWP